MNKNIKVILLIPGEAPEVITIHGRLEDLQNAVGGNIQIVSCGAEGYEDCLLVIDEEGKLKDSPKTNCRASYFYGVPSSIDCIVGTALLCGSDKFGDVDSIPNDVMRRVMRNEDVQG